MAKFCTHCGRPLQDGEICQCQSGAAADTSAAGAADQQASSDANGGYQQAAPNAQQYAQPNPGTAAQQNPYQPAPGQYASAAPQAPSGFSLYMHQLCECFKAFFNDAGATIGTAGAHKDIKSGLTYACLAFVMYGLSSISLVSTAMRSITNGVGSLLGSTGMSSSVMSAASSYIKIPYGSLFFTVLLLVAVEFFAVCGIGAIVSSIIKSNASFGSIMAAVGVGMIPTAILAAASALFGLLWLPLGFFFGIAATITWLLTSYTAIKLSTGATDRKLLIYFGVIIAIIFAIVGAIFSAAVKSMLVSTMTSSLGSMSSLLK